MKRLTYLVVILAVIYGGYWFVGSSALENGVKAELAEMADNGWQVEYDTLETRGFPSRFDTTITDVSIAAPDGSLSYDAEMLQALALSYRPNRVIAVLPDTQLLTVGNLPLTITSDGLRASLGVAANTAATLKDLTAEAASVAVTARSEQLVSLENLIGAVREINDETHVYATFFSANEIALSDQMRTQIDPNGALPATIEIAKLDATLTLDRPLNRHTLPAWETDPGKLQGFSVQELQMKWGPYEIKGDGAMTIAEDGTLDGTITLRLNDWEGMLTLTQDAGLLPLQIAFVARGMGTRLSGGAVDMTLPITVEAGNLSIGPLSLGTAPKVR